jgi:hypothetical protein
MEKDNSSSIQLAAEQLTLTNGFIFDFIPDQLIEYVVGWNKNRTRV